MTIMKLEDISKKQKKRIEQSKIQRMKNLIERTLKRLDKNKTIETLIVFPKK